MRKQDRVAQQQQSRPDKEHHKEAQPGQRQPEQVKGSASKDQPTRAPRQGGRLPLPD